MSIPITARPGKIAPPRRFEPQFRQYPWGGRRLAEWYPTAPPDGPVSEAWLLSDLDPTPSVVADGSGRTIRDLYPGRFPLLCKVLDARESLSVQVHPDDAHSLRTTGRVQGKSEAWFVLDARPGGTIWAGLRPGVGPDELRQACVTERVEDCLNAIAAEPGMIVYLPAGTVHALGAGVVVFEVQQTSDLTYRLFDWNRVDVRTGLRRELHVEAAIACTKFDARPAAALPQFTIGEVRGSVVRNDGRWRVLFGHDGRSAVTTAGGAAVIEPGELVLVPPSAGGCEVEVKSGGVIEVVLAE